MKLPELIESLNPAKVFFSAGARNAPLLEMLKNYQIEFGSDDRVLAFKAMGLAKVTNQSVIVCTTSGTAVAEAMPAMIEAYYSEIPLVLLAADRPRALDESWAPQMIDQKKFLKLYSRDSVDSEVEEDFPLQQPIKFPIFINARVNLEQTEANKVRYQETFPTEIDFNQTLFIINSNDKKLVDELLDKLEDKPCYIYQELNSSHYEKTLKNEILFDEVLQKLDKIKQVVRIGSCPNSKFWRKLKDIPLYHIHKKNRPSHFYGTVLTNHQASVQQILNFQFDMSLKEDRSSLSYEVDQLIEEFENSEVHLIKQILNRIPKGKIFWGNSMPIRYAKFFKHQHESLSSRGANGIDGLISTVIGIAQGSDQLVYAFIGDLSFEYDISALFGEWPNNLFVFILNNGGGRIFERINLDQKVVTPHERTYQSLVESFGLSFALWNKDLKLAELNIIEVRIDNDQSNNFWKDYHSLVENLV